MRVGHRLGAVALKRHMRVLGPDGGCLLQPTLRVSPAHADPKPDDSDRRDDHHVGSRLAEKERGETRACRPDRHQPGHDREIEGKPAHEAGDPHRGEARIAPQAEDAAAIFPGRTTFGPSAKRHPPPGSTARRGRVPRIARHRRERAGRASGLPNT